MEAKRKTISLFLYIPEKKVIVLAVRARTQSHPGMLQATAHGTIEAGEDHADAIERELKEETQLDIIHIGPVTFLGELDAGHKMVEACSCYLAPITEEVAAKLRPTDEVAQFAHINKEAIGNMIAWSEKKEKTIDTRVHRMMFKDELEALEMAFDMLEEHKWNLIGS